MRFQDALDRKGEEIERPPLAPMGTYRWVVSKMPEMDTIANGRFDVVDFTLKCLEPSEDVDPDAIAEYAAKAGAITSLVRRHRFLFNTEDEGAFNKTLFRLKQFLAQHLGVEGIDDISMKEALAESVNRHVLASIKWRPDPNDSEIMYDEIDRTAPVD